MRATDEEQVFHTFATWNDWAWRLTIATDLAESCRVHYHRMPHQYNDDPPPRARDYVRRFDPPWSRAAPV